MSSEKHSRQDDRERFKSLVEKVGFAMFTTSSADDGQLRSRPMTLQEVDDDNNLWFFASRKAPIAADIMSNQKVNLGFSSPEKSVYVSVSATARIIEDQMKKKELFSPAVKAWFPEGLEDPDLMLIQCEGLCADYWDTPSSKVVQLYAFAKSMITGESPEHDLGKHSHIQLH